MMERPDIERLETSPQLLGALVEAAEHDTTMITLPPSQEATRIPLRMSFRPGDTVPLHRTAPAVQAALDEIRRLNAALAKLAAELSEAQAALEGEKAHPDAGLMVVPRDQLVRLALEAGRAPSMTFDALDMIRRELARARSKYPPEHDLQHDRDELRLAALCYLAPDCVNVRDFWPWDDTSPDIGLSRQGEVPTTQLVKGAGLIAAEIDRRRLAQGGEIWATT